MKLRALLFAGLCVIAGQANSGLFSDDEAHQQIQQLVARISRLEEKLQETSKQLEAGKLQTQAMFDLQTQIEAQNVELSKLRGQNEEIVHNLQDAEKRQKDFYVDLDTRMRHFETLATTAATVATAPPPASPVAPQIANDIATPLAADDPALENRAYETAYALFKTGNHQKAVSAFQEFPKKFPESVHLPNVYFQMGGAYFALNEYRNALDSYQLLIRKYSYSPIVPEAMLELADCQKMLNDKVSAKKTLQQIIAKYPGSKTADKARNLLKTYK